MTAPVQDVWARYMLDTQASWIGDVTQLPPPGGGGIPDLVGTAGQAATDAANSLLLANETATGANGINADFWVTSAPTQRPNGDALVVNDNWFKTDGSGHVIGVYLWSGSAWVAQPLTSAVFAYIDAGVITVGTLHAINLLGNWIETKANVGTGTAPSIVAGILMSSSNVNPNGNTAPSVVGTQGGMWAFNGNGAYFILDASTSTLQVGSGSQYFQYSASTGNMVLVGGSFTAPTINGGTVNAGTGGAGVSRMGLGLDSSGLTDRPTLWWINSSNVGTFKITGAQWGTADGTTQFISLDGLSLGTMHLHAANVAVSGNLNASAISATSSISGSNSNPVWLSARASQLTVDRGETTVTTDGSGVATISHNLGATPTVAIAGGNDAAYFIRTSAKTSTQFTVTVRNAAGTVNSTAVVIDWIAVT